MRLLALVCTVCSSPWRRNQVVGSALLLASIGVGFGCAEDVDTPPGPRQSSAGVTRPFTDMFELARTFTPEQPDSALLVRVTDLEVDSAGRFIVVDYSEANVKVYGPGGRLEHVIGGHGQGPTEFAAAEYLALSDNTLAYVGGSSTHRLGLVNLDDGVIEETIPLKGVSGAFGLVVTSDGALYTSVRTAVDGSDALARVDPSGAVAARHVPIHIESATARAAWNVFVGQSLGIVNDTIWILPEVSDTAWTFDTRTAAVSRIGIPLANYTPPSERPERLLSATDYLDWRRKFDGPLAPLQLDSFTIVPFVRGSRNDGDQVSLAVRSPAGVWQTLTHAPAVVGAFADTLVAIVDPTANILQFALYSLRPEDDE